MSSARVNRPTSCSSWAIRSASASECLSADSKRVAAFSRSCRFHFESCSSLRLCRRHTSACELSPLSASRTTSALYSGVKFLRFRLVLHRILLSSRWILYHNLVLGSGPNFRWQYISLYKNFQLFIKLTLSVQLETQHLLTHAALDCWVSLCLS